MSIIGNYNGRIKKEIENLQKNPKDDVGLYKVFSNNRNFYGFIRGPADSPFENGYFKLFIHLKDDYPFCPPIIKFMTKVYHPNISSQTGMICLDILKDKWTAGLSINTALLSIQALLTDPVPTDPQDHLVAVLYMDDKEKYIQKAKEWTELYAKEDVETENETFISELCEDYDENSVLNTVSQNIWVKDRAIKALEEAKLKAKK